MEEKLQNLKNQLMLDPTNTRLIHDYFLMLKRLGLEEINFRVGDIVIVDENYEDFEYWNPFYVWIGRVISIFQQPQELLIQGLRFYIADRHRDRGDYRSYNNYLFKAKNVIVVRPFDPDEAEQERIYFLKNFKLDSDLPPSI